MTATTEASPTQKIKAVRRRAVRAAGPAKGAESAAAEPTTVRLEKPPVTKKPKRKAGPPPRREPHRRLVAIVALAAGFLVAVILGGGVFALWSHQHGVETDQARNQQFVDTAVQLAVNMYSYKQDTVDDNVKNIVNSTSGPLHDMLMVPNNTEVLKRFFRSLGGSAEAVVTGAALEKVQRVDKATREASVLVSVRVTTTDMNGNNQPSVPSRMRITVREDESTGRMTGYDLKWPDGGN